MADELKTIRITAQMITNLELTLNVPADMTDDEIYQRYAVDGEVEGDAMTEPKDDNGGWEWSNEIESLEFNPDAPVYFKD